MEEEVLVKVSNVSKKFCKDLKTSLKYGFLDSLSAILPGKNDESSELRKLEFWAVQNVNFELKRGDCIGLIGHNGAGKSTLMKVINGLIRPDSGEIVMKGKIGALIELGAGFNPILTGRENIYNNAAILGFQKKEIDDKLDDIIAFSEIEEFIDTPVKNYSSGMKVRLGFAVAAHLEPDVLIIDEVLAVGDLSFRLKCFKKIDEISEKTAIIFVSHNMSQISRMCNKIILLEKGQIVYSGSDIAKGVELYYGKTNALGHSIIFDTKEVSLDFFELISHSDDQVRWNDSITIKFGLNILSEAITKTPNVNIHIFDKEDRSVAVLDNSDIEKMTKEIVNNHVEYQFSIDNLQLSKGQYYMGMGVSESKSFNPMLKIQYLKKILVTDEREIWPAFLLKSKWKIN